MARLSNPFSSLPQNPNARRRIYRNARTGRRPKPHTPNIGDAMHTITAVQRSKEAFEREQENIPFLQVLADSWVARKDWRD
jgi:hypothetical protein